MKFKLVLLSLLLSMFSSCGFYSFKGSTPSHINSLVITPIQNKTSEFYLTDLLNDKFINFILLENFIDIADYEEADSKLDLSIISLNDNPNVYNIDNNANYEVVNEWKISINVEIVWYDLVNNKDIIKKNVSEWATYSLGIDIGVDGLDNDLDGLVDSEDEDEYGTPREGAIRIALEKISKRIINELTSTW